MNWSTGDEHAASYFRVTRDRGPNPFLLRLEPFLGGPGHVLDLGAGVGHSSLWFVERGWTVTSVEPNADARAYFAELVGERRDVTVTTLPFHEADFGRNDAVLALFSLFFEEADRFADTWSRLVESLAPGGLFAGQFLGPNDDWSRECTTHTREHVEALFQGWETLLYEEAERDGETALGTPKHWHVHHVIARKA